MNDKNMLKIEKVYSFTLNPCDEVQEFKRRTARDYFTSEQVIKRLDNVKRYCNYILLPEISHRGRYHYHGLIQIIDVIGFYLYAIPYLDKWAKFEIDTINCLTKWSLYCTKNMEVMKLCGKHWYGYMINHTTPREKPDIRHSTGFREYL